MYIGGVYHVYNSGSLKVPLDSWSLVVYALSGTTLTMYINGASYSQTIAGTPSATINPLRIGTYSGNNAYTFNGTIADVQVYKTALTASQMQQLYQQGLPQYKKFAIELG